MPASFRITPGEPVTGSAFLHRTAGGANVVRRPPWSGVSSPDPGRAWRELTSVVKLLAANHWPFRLHATYNESITRTLDVFEAVDREIPLAGLHWFIGHAETIDARNIDRIGALGGGIARSFLGGDTGRLVGHPASQ